MLKSFYDTLYFYHYNKVKKRDAHPEIVTLGLISFCQGTNLISMYILLSFIFDFSFNKYIMIGILISMFIINYYHYQIKGVGKKILKEDNRPMSKNTRIKSFIYSFCSAFLPLALIYIKNEFF